MKYALFAISRLFAGIALIVSAIAAPIIYLFDLAFPVEAPPLDRSADAPSTEVAERMSQTGKGVWAFVTDLFKVEGRSYLWQGGDVA